MQNHFDVAIIGGGIAGNTCALAMAQIGLRVAHVSLDTPVALNETLDARIYALSNSNVELFKRLRVWDAIDHSRICPVADMRIAGDDESTGRGLLELNAYSAHMTELAWIIEQNNMQRALQMALKFVPNVSTFRCNAQALTQLEDGVNILTDAGNNITASLLIGADGANSWTRQALQIELETFDYEQSGIVANFACEKPHHHCAHQWFLDNGDVLALLPLPNQRVSIVYSCSQSKVPDMMALSESDFAALISDLSKHTLGALTSLAPAQAFPLKRRKAKSFIGQNSLLIGDAAHTVHPLAGQGLNLGLQDVNAWLNILQNREAHRAINDPVLLRRYERERIVPTIEMQGVTHALNRLFHHPHPIAKHARNVGMNLLNILPPIKRRLIQSAMGSITPPKS